MTTVDPLVPAGARAVPNEPDLYDAPPAPANGKGNGHRPKPARDLLPHDLVAERSLLGAALLGAVQPVLDLPDGAFYSPAHGHIAASIRHVAAAGGYVDAVTIGDHLRAHDLLDAAGGYQAIAEIMATCPASSAAPAYAHIVRGHWRTRQLIHAGTELATVARNQGPDAAYELLRPLVDDNAPGAVDVAWEDVGAVVAGDYEPMRPTILTRTDGQALIYPGLLHWLMGEPGKGKTWVALHIAAEQLQAGHHVLYLDWEGNRQIVGERLGALGCTADQVADGLHYFRPPAITRALAAALAAKAAEHRATIVILDGVAKALARNDYNEDKAPDVLAWLELLVTPLTNTGAAAICLDHVVKDKDTRGSWARGSGAKIGEVSGASWMVRPKTPFSRTQSGELELVQTKDREGHVGIDGAVVARVLIHPTNEGAQVAITVEPPAGGPTGAFRPTGLMQLVSATVASLNDGQEPATQNKVFQLVPGAKAHKLVALQRLIDEGYIGTTPAPRRGTHHHTVTVYRELDDPLSDRYSPPDEPPDDALEPDPGYEDF